MDSFKPPEPPSNSSPHDSCSSLLLPERKRKGPVPKLYGDEICLICDDKATGFHYGALSCEACKGFFRRTKLKKIIDYRCKFSKNCNIAEQRVDKSVKRICQYCRYTKCVNLGMKDNVRHGEVIQDLQRFMQSNPGYAPSKHVLESKDIDDVIANVKKEEQQQQQNGITINNRFQHTNNNNHINNLSSSFSQSNSIANRKHNNIRPSSPVSLGINKKSPKPINNSNNPPSPKRTKKQQPITYSLPSQPNFSKIYDNVQENQEYLDELESVSFKFLDRAHPQIAEIALCTSWRAGNTPADQQARIQHFTDKGIINAKITTRQVQCAEEFHNLETKDQLIILKQSMVEVIYLRLAQNYNRSDQTMTCIKDGSRYPKTYFTLVGHDIKYADAVWKFCHQMNYLLRDKEIITCVFFIIVFNSSRDNLSDTSVQLLDKARQKYLLFLKIHCKRKYMNTYPLLYCHLLMKLADMSNLMDMNLEQIKKSEMVLERFPFQPDACGKHLRSTQNVGVNDKQVEVEDFMNMSAPVSYMKNNGNSNNNHHQSNFQ